MLVPNDDITFSFSSKEREAETGYGYFGARYMDHELMTSFSALMYPPTYPLATCLPLRQPPAVFVWHAIITLELR